MSKRWYQENRRDPWRREARSKGYRARSAYKLKQIQDKFGIIRKGDSVLDVGCHPGGWTQVVKEKVGEKGTVIGVDIQNIKEIEGTFFINKSISQLEDKDFKEFKHFKDIKDLRIFTSRQTQTFAKSLNLLRGGLFLIVRDCS